MTRLLRLRPCRRHRQHPPVEIDLVPPGIQDLAFAGTGVEQQPDHLAHLNIAVGVQLIKQPLHLVGRQVTLPRTVVLEVLDAIAGVALGWQDVPADCAVVDELHQHDHPVAGARRVALLEHRVVEGHHIRAGDPVHPELGKHRQQVIAQHRLVRLPAALAGLGVGEVTLGHEIPEGRHILEAVALHLRVAALGDHLLHLVRLGPGVRHRNLISPADPVQPYLAGCIAVAEVKGRPAAGAMLQQKALDLRIEVTHGPGGRLATWQRGQEFGRQRLCRHRRAPLSVEGHATIQCAGKDIKSV